AVHAVPQNPHPILIGDYNTVVPRIDAPRLGEQRLIGGPVRPARLTTGTGQRCDVVVAVAEIHALETMLTRVSDKQRWGSAYIGIGYTGRIEKAVRIVRAAGQGFHSTVRMKLANGVVVAVGHINVAPLIHSQSGRKIEPRVVTVGKAGLRHLPGQGA